MGKTAERIVHKPLYVIFRNSGSLGSRVCLLTNLGKILCSSKSQEIQMFCKQSCNLWFHTSLYMKLKNEQELSHWNSITTFLDTFKMQLMSFIVLPLDRICCYCYNIFLEENDNPEVCGINAYFAVQHTYYLSEIWKLPAFDKVCQPQQRLAAAEFFSIKPHNITLSHRVCGMLSLDVALP